MEELVTVKIVRVRSRPGAAEERIEGDRGFELVDRRISGQKNKVENSTFVRSIDEAAYLVEQGFAIRMGAVGKPHHEVEGWLRSGLQCTGRGRRRRPDHCRARTDAVRQRSGPAGAPDRGQISAASRSRPQRTPATAANPISKRSKHTASTAMSRPDAPSTRQQRTEKSADR